MLDSLKCPFCGTELVEEYDDGFVIGLFCPNHCKTFRSMDKNIWQALIDGKKAQDALKVATYCIKNIGNTWRGNQSWSNDDMDEIRINIENYCDGTLQKIKELKK